MHLEPDQEVAQRFSVTRDRVRLIEAESKTTEGQGAAQTQASEPEPKDAQVLGSVIRDSSQSLHSTKRKMIIPSLTG
jgi:hypothetical protein